MTNRGRFSVVITTLAVAALLPGCAWISRASVSSGPQNQQANQLSGLVSISHGGRFTVFSSTAANLVAGDINTVSDVFVRDNVLNTTERVSLTDGDSEANEASTNGEQAFASFPSYSPVISGDGRTVAYTVTAPRIDQPFTLPLGPFVRNLDTGTTRLMAPPPGFSDFIVPGDYDLSDDGTRIAFVEVTLSANPIGYASVRDTATGTTIASLRSTHLSLAGTQPFPVAISGDGTVLGGRTYLGGNLVGAVRRTLTSSWKVVSADSEGKHPAAVGDFDLSGNGRWVAFSSASSDLVFADTNGVEDAFTRSVGKSGPPKP